MKIKIRIRKHLCIWPFVFKWVRKKKYFYGKMIIMILQQRIFFHCQYFKFSLKMKVMGLNSGYQFFNRFYFTVRFSDIRFTPFVLSLRNKPGVIWDWYLQDQGVRKPEFCNTLYFNKSIDTHGFYSPLRRDRELSYSEGIRYSKVLLWCQRYLRK